MEGIWNETVLVADERLNLCLLFQQELSSLLCLYINI